MGSACWLAARGASLTPSSGPVMPRPIVIVGSPSAGAVAAIGSGATSVTGARSTITATSRTAADAL